MACFAKENFETVWFEPSVVVKEEKVFARSAAGGAVVSFAVAQVGSVLNELAVGCAGQKDFSETIRSVRRQVIGDNDFDFAADGLVKDRVDAVFKPLTAVVI